MPEASRSAPKDKPYAFALLTGVVAVVITIIMLLWGGASPEAVLIGREGVHDGQDGERLAACLDCHVPFVGTPGSRCLGPGCHGDLATGTPPRDGPAMPVRFHTVLRDRPCGMCHEEHVALGAGTSSRAFSHSLIPEDAVTECHRCHSGGGVPGHATADAVQCSRCHEHTRWNGIAIDHSRVSNAACDLCHAAPETETHASVAGTCQECHESNNWSPKAIEPAP